MQFKLGWPELANHAGQRPALLLRRENSYSYPSEFVVAEVTPLVRAIPKASSANCDNRFGCEELTAILL